MGAQALAGLPIAFSAAAIKRPDVQVFLIR